MRRTDVLFFGTMIGITITMIIVMLFDLKLLQHTIFEDNWITLIWLGLLSVIILPVRFFPKTKWAKWWDGRGFSKN